MPHPRSPWSPSEGDAVRLKDSGFVGTVIETQGVHEARFSATASLSAVGGGTLTRKRAGAAARRASRWYGLDELEPPS